MNIRKLTEKVTYTGVNDRVTALFEGLWPLPAGVSYNSYVVKGEKIAVVDTVEISHAREFFGYIKNIAGNRGVDYLVVNHMEPDHSATIPDLLAIYPEMKIVGNKQTVSMIEGFYGISDPDRFHVVADGDTLDLGNDTVLKFFMTPMVHWPETMMTYLVSEKVLFSGDAFGTYGALNGGICDSETDVRPYFEEAYRYYSNIVGKYGKFVQKALDKLADVELNMICPTHGPVWKEKIDEVVAMTSRLSRGECERGVTLVYGSMYGNTAALAETIAMQLAECGVKEIRVHNASTSSLSNMLSDTFRYKGLIVGAPTYSMSLFPPVEQFMKALETREVRGKVLGLFGSYTWAPAALKRLQEFASLLQTVPVGEFSMKQAPKASDFETARNLAKTVADQLK